MNVPSKYYAVDKDYVDQSISILKEQIETALNDSDDKLYISLQDRLVIYQYIRDYPVLTDDNWWK